MNENQVENPVESKTVVAVAPAKAKGVGRGRRVGSYSFVSVPAETLAGIPNVIVSRKWLEAIGLAGNVVAKNSLETYVKATVAEPTATPVSFSVED